MNEVPINLTCPLGHKCEVAKDGVIERCNWYTRLEGINPQTGDKQDEYGCAITWFPILLIENTQQNRGTSAAVESFRNEMVIANDKTTKLLGA